MNALSRYPIGIENFEKLRKGNFLYVDKTEFLHKLVEAEGYFLLCRPRRFGKSLFMSTAQAFFEGKRELFEGLAIDKYDYDWKPCPVLHLNLVDVDTTNPENLKIRFSEQFEKWERVYGINKPSQLLSSRFGNIIRRAHEQTGRKVAILIDEYDKPLVSNIDNEEIKNTFCNILKPLYSNLKACDRYIRFALLTGVSRFSRLSIFSDLNNLNDISMDNDMAGICGLTEQELLNYCHSGISSLADAEGHSYDETVAKLKDNYDGYHFARVSPDVYNPFSLFCALSKQEIGDYWFATGTPTFLLKSLMSKGVNLEDYFNSETDAQTLSQIDAFSSNVLPMMFQTGYLTIKDYDRETGDYRIGIPNKEVSRGIFRGLLPLYAHKDGDESYSFIRESSKALREGNPEKFVKGLQSFLADIPYNLSKNQHEIYFENNIYVIFKLLGIHIHTEYLTSCGRIDVLVQTPKYVYVIELKLDKSAQEAMQQIEDKGYTIPFKADGRKIFTIGANISSDTRTITDWVINPNH